MTSLIPSIAKYILRNDCHFVVDIAFAPEDLERLLGDLSTCRVERNATIAVDKLSRSPIAATVYASHLDFIMSIPFSTLSTTINSHDRLLSVRLRAMVPIDSTVQKRRKEAGEMKVQTKLEQSSLTK